MFNTCFFFFIPGLQLPLEFGILDLSAVSVETGLLSVAAALPGATAISALFRLREVKLIRSRVQQRDDRRTEKDQGGGEGWIFSSTFCQHNNIHGNIYFKILPGRSCPCYQNRFMV